MEGHKWNSAELEELADIASGSTLMMIRQTIISVLVELDKLCADIIYLRSKIEEIQAILDEHGLIFDQEGDEGEQESRHD